jgi:hypothetical protein
LGKILGGIVCVIAQIRYVEIRFSNPLMTTSDHNVDINSLFQSKKYIGPNFLTLYQRKDTPFVPTHVESGPWMRKAGHSHSLIACLVRCTTGHAPIRAYHSRFVPEESTACRCGFPMETVSHVLYQCPSHVRESDPKEQLRYSWLLKFLEANKSAFAFDTP